MAITINGNGTITGISVGGLPDGIVDTDMIANNAVTNAKATGIAGGKLLQTATGTTSSDTTHDETAWTDTGLTASITPSATNSKILILISQSFEIAASANSADGGGSFRLLRDSTVIEAATSGGGTGNPHRFYNYGNGLTSLSHYDNYGSSFLDSPNTTSSVTYKTQGKAYYGSHTIKSQASSIASYIILMEIAA